MGQATYPKAQRKVVASPLQRRYQGLHLILSIQYHPLMQAHHQVLDSEHSHSNLP